tara:strand:- start:356 stop:1282 length:927 start_codon:yes stop_codon:yes gene_type:complete
LQYNVKIPLLIVISGPTAVGKTRLSIELAKKNKTSIFSSDSRQFYKEMSIGTAKPSTKQLNVVSHYFINNKSINDIYSAGDYEKEIIIDLEKYFINNNKAFLVGGSGMYVDAVCKGLDQLPKDLKIRNHLNTKLNKDGLESLQKKLKQLDPIHYDKIDLNNSQRLIRALEVCYISSKPYSSFLKSEIKKRSFKIIKFLLHLDKEKLYSNIDQRVDKMVEDGLFEEVKSLRAFKNLNALKTVGYNEVFNFLKGDISKNDAIELIKVNTKKYAKRQMTWFKKDPTYHWIENTDINQSINEIQSILINIKA